MDRRVAPLKRVTSPTWGPPPPCKQALIVIALSYVRPKRLIFIPVVEEELQLSFFLLPCTQPG